MTIQLIWRLDCWTRRSILLVTSEQLYWGLFNGEKCLWLDTVIEFNLHTTIFLTCKKRMRRNWQPILIWGSLSTSGTEKMSTKAHPLWVEIPWKISRLLDFCGSGTKGIDLNYLRRYSLFGTYSTAVLLSQCQKSEHDSVQRFCPKPVKLSL